MLLFLASLLIAGVATWPATTSTSRGFTGPTTWTACKGPNCQSFNFPGFSHPGFNWTGGYFPGFNCSGGTCKPFYHPGFTWTGGSFFPGFNFTCTGKTCSNFYYPGFNCTTGEPCTGFFYPGYNCTNGVCSPFYHAGFSWTGGYFPGYNCTGNTCTPFYHPAFNWTGGQFPGFTCTNGMCWFPGYYCNAGTCTGFFYPGFNCIGGNCWFPGFTCSGKACYMPEYGNFIGPMPAWYYNYITGFNCTGGMCAFPTGMTTWCPTGGCGGATPGLFPSTVTTSTPWPTSSPYFYGPMPTWYYNYFNDYYNVQYFPFSNTTFPNWYYRGEFQFLDFQMNQTMPFSSYLMSDIEIYFNVTYGYHPYGMTTTFAGPMPPTTESFGQMFAGNYNGMTPPNNFINIDRTWIADTCGYNWTMGYMNFWIRPMANSNPGVFEEGFYTCFFNFTFPTVYTPKSMATWSPVFQCNSGPVNNYSYRFWYQFRMYNIPFEQCGWGKFVTL